MKFNDRDISKVNFIVRDRITYQCFGEQLNLGVAYEELPDIIYFEDLAELKDTIDLLTDICNKAIQFRESK